MSFYLFISKQIGKVHERFAIYMKRIHHYSEIELSLIAFTGKGIYDFHFHQIIFTHFALFHVDNRR